MSQLTIPKTSEEKAQMWQSTGDAFFAKNDFNSALRAYTMGSNLTQDLELKVTFVVRRMNAHIRNDQATSAMSTGIEGLELEGINTEQKVRLYHQLGASCFEAKELPAAEKAYKKGLALDRNHSGLHKDLGSVYWENEQNDKAIREFNKSLALENDPEKKAVIFHDCICPFYKGAKQYPEAVAAFKEALKLKHDNDFLKENLSLSLGQLYLEMKQYDKALKAGHSAVEFNNGDTSDCKGKFRRRGFAFSLLGETYFAMKEFEKASYNFDMSWRGHSDSGNQSLSHKQVERKMDADLQRGMKCRKQGSALFAKKQYAESLKVYQEGLAFADMNLKLKVRLLAGIADAHHAMKNYPEAIKMFIEALFQDFDDRSIKAGLCARKGQTHMAMKSYQEAVYCFCSGLTYENNPESELGKYLTRKLQDATEKSKKQSEK